MQDRQSRVSEEVKSMVHGKASRDRCNQPCMFEILSWAQLDAEHARRGHTKINDQCEVLSPNHEAQCPHGNGKEFEVYSYHREQRQQVQRERQQIEEMRANEHIRCPENNLQKQQEGINLQKKKTLKPKQIQDHLYMQDEVHLKRSISQNFNRTNQSKLKEQVKTFKIQQAPKLDEKNEKDRQIIEQRKQKIKQFDYFSRDLPNSSFATYYGKPAFQAYGRGNADEHLKTHNVMPHRGENHPKQFQSYIGALKQGRKLKTQSYLPRKPIQNLPVHNNRTSKEEEIIYLPMEAPDLINHVRFAETAKNPHKKSPIPTQPTRRTEKKLQHAYEPKKKKLKTKTKGKNPYNDGLKYMSPRDNLLQLLEEKKTKDSRLAYKVTECYPFGWPHEELAYEEQAPAGIKYKRGQSAKQLIYTTL